MPEVNRAVLERAIGRWNEGNLSGYLELYDPGAMLYGYQGVEPGFEGIRRFYEAFWAAFPGSRITLEDVISEGDEVSARFTLRATHGGDFNGIPATGLEVSLPGITILRFADGKCVERWSQADFLGLMQQIGAIPATEGAEA